MCVWGGACLWQPISTKMRMHHCQGPQIGRELERPRDAPVTVFTINPPSRVKGVPHVASQGA